MLCAFCVTMLGGSSCWRSLSVLFTTFWKGAANLLILGLNLPCCSSLKRNFANLNRNIFHVQRMRKPTLLSVSRTSWERSATTSSKRLTSHVQEFVSDRIDTQRLPCSHRGRWQIELAFCFSWNRRRHESSPVPPSRVRSSSLGPSRRTQDQARVLPVQVKKWQQRARG